MTMTEKEKRFLEEYVELCFRHGVCVDACGCCASPYVHTMNGTEVKMLCTQGGERIGFYEEQAKYADSDATYVIRKED